MNLIQAWFLLCFDTKIPKNHRGGNPRKTFDVAMKGKKEFQSEGPVF